MKLFIIRTTIKHCAEERKRNRKKKNETTANRNNVKKEAHTQCPGHR